MRILTVFELKALPNIDEDALTFLQPIFKNHKTREFLASCEKEFISAQDMVEKTGVNCHILFVKSSNGIKPVAVPIENRISGGGKSYCIQYKAYGLDDGKTYFVKSIQMNRESLPEYHNEKETLLKLKRLIGAVFCKKTEVHYLVATFVQGMVLAKYKQEIPSSVEVKHFMESVGVIISASHEIKKFHDLDLIHRDIKPGNIMLDVDRQCRLVDFGSSSSDQGLKPSSWGTGAYLAPELDLTREELAFTKETDLYALGYSLHEIYEKFTSAKFAKVTIGKQNTHLASLHTELGICINGLMSTDSSQRTSSFTRLTLLQRVPESFASKPEAYTFTIMLLTQWKVCYSNTLSLDKTIEAIKVFYENHEQNADFVKASLIDLNNVGNLLKPHVALLAVLIHSFDHIQKSKVDDLLPRRFESDFASHLIQAPTKKMMEAVKQVSDAIIKILREYENCGVASPEYKVIQDFLNAIVESDILFGALNTKPSLKDVIELLSQNKTEDFVTIQHVSFKFAQIALRKLPLNDLPTHRPTGQFLAILEKYQQATNATKEDFLSFYHRMAAIKDEGEEIGEGYLFRAYICDVLFYRDELFTFDATRGRKGSPNTALKTNQVGLMKFEHAAHTKGLLTLPGQSWYADCKTQPKKEDSIHCTSAEATDCPHITGPSGMTSLFMNMLFLLINPKDSETILAYSLSVTAYIVGAGYHSIKEILIPMVKCIDMLPDYPKHQGMEYLTASPLYNHYFKAIEKFDDEFGVLHQKIWASHLEYFENTFMPICMRNHCLLHQISELTMTEEAKDMAAIVTQSVQSCLLVYGKASTGGMSIFTTSRDNQTMALELLDKICQQQLTLTSVVRHIQSYFGTNFSVGNGIQISKEMQMFYIGFLLNALKNQPTLLSHLNLAMNIEKSISISPEMDMRSEHHGEQRKKIFVTIKNSNIADRVEDSIAPLYETASTTPIAAPSVIYLQLN